MGIVFRFWFRISAVHSLKMSQLDLENNMFRGVGEKMGKVRDLFFFTSTKSFTRVDKDKGKERYRNRLFVYYFYKTSNQMSQTAIRRRVRKMEV